MKVRLAGFLGLFVISTVSLQAAEGQASLPAEAFEAQGQAFPANVAEVIKLSQSGVSQDVVLAYVAHEKSSYRMTAEDVLALKDAGLSSQVITAMIAHDKNQAKSVALKEPARTLDVVQAPGVKNTPEAPPPQPAPVVAPQPAPPPQRVEIVPVAPGPDYYWTDGYWSWRGGAWVWVGGCWGVRPGVTFIIGGHRHYGHWHHR